MLILDVWWGWLHPNFRAHIRSHYPWIILIFCPAACTPVFQPCNLGVIRTLKACVLWLCEICAAEEVVRQLQNSVLPADMRLYNGAPQMKKNMALWWGQTTRAAGPEVGRSAFEKANLLTAWDAAVQRQALGRIGELFSDITDLRLSDSGYTQITDELEQARALVGYDLDEDFGDE